MDPKPANSGICSGTVLDGKWTLAELIGTGGTAHVYRAIHHNGAKVAIKVLQPHLLHNPAITSRFEREAVMANRVDDPGVVQVQDGGVTEDGCPFLVTELLQGETLESLRVSAGGKLPLEQVLQVADELLRVLACAHAQRVLHRDIKPSNLFRTNRGELKILDFGLARDFEPDAGSSTSYNTVLGTVGFMAPEQAQGRWDLVDETTDVWAAAATLLKLATGLDIHEGETPQERVALAATKPVPSISKRAPELPESFAKALEKATAYSKRERFRSAQQLREALCPATGTQASSQQTAATAMSWSPRSVAIAGVVIGGLLGGLIWFIRDHGQGDPPQEPALPFVSPSAPPSDALSTSASLPSANPVDAGPSSIPTVRGPSHLSAEKPSASSVPALAPSATVLPTVVPSVNPLDRRH